ncbi:AAA family ATPase [Pedobacter agri]|uniref:AAA family ATPase n=1 Tax=Pedobacter agri TaxID=454586 RepID=A0A9X3DDQ3_9SPHI|nr:AAA family ATPase [Pedobacter agri]MCX3264225.1 AAA family ATPase [Pedobacter agri]
MIYFHYCQNYLENTNDQSAKLILKKLTEYSVRDTLRGINSIACHTGGIFVLNISSPHLKIIMEEKRIDFGEKQITVYFVRDLLNASSMYNWLQYYVEIRDGKWLEYNPLPDFEQNAFIHYYESTSNAVGKKKEYPPNNLIEWHRDYRLKVDYDIYESEDWVKFAINSSPSDGMKDDEAKLYKLALDSLSNGELNNHASYETICIRENCDIRVVELHDICIYYLEIILPTVNTPIFLLINGANKVTQFDHYNNIKENLKDRDYKIDSIERVQRLALRAYPKWALKNADLWKAIQKNSETGNLSLLPEQTVFLKEFTFPKYINGQAGSGKSTMLYYLFANTYYFKCFGEIEGDVIFLTENENLLKHTKKSVVELLQCNPEFELSFEDISNVDKNFMSFKNFLLSQIPDDVDSFRNDKYLDFSRFKMLYESSAIPTHVIKKYSAELSWFILSTYINGYDLDFQITSENYEEKMPSEGKKLVSLDDLRGIEREILPFYRKQIEENGYWDKIKIIRYIKDNLQKEKLYEVIFCDEAQDFSRVELRYILGLSSYLHYDLSTTEQVPIVFAGDALQTVNPTGFRAAEVKDMLYEELKQIAGFKLDTDKIEYAPEFNYRSSQAIVNVANAIQYWRKKNFESIIKKPQIAKRPEFGKDNNLNIFIDFKSVEQNENNIIDKLKYKIFIIPVNFDDKEEYIRTNAILKSFPEANIKTAVEAKGIDYEQVVIFGFGEYGMSIENLEEYERRFFYNKLYVAVTRAQLELIILDSNDSQEKFWLKMIRFYADSSWSNDSGVQPKEIQETIVFGANQIPQILQSTPEMALANAYKDKEQGVFSKNPFLLRIAAHQFLKLGKKDEHFICLALMYKLREEWHESAKYYLNKDVGYQGIPEAALIYWEGKLLNEFLKFSLKPENEENHIKTIIATLMLTGELEGSQLRSLRESRNKIRGILYDTPWMHEIINQLLQLLETSSDTESIKLLIDVFEEICSNEYTDVWLKIGEKNLQIKRYEYAVEAFEKIGHEGVSFITAKIQISKQSGKVIEEVFWLGSLMKEPQLNELKRKEIRSEIIELYKLNREIFIQDGITPPQTLLFIYSSLLKEGNLHSDILLICKCAEKTFLQINKKTVEIVTFYHQFMIESKRNTEIFQFVLTRWVRTMLLGGFHIPEVNEIYRAVCAANKIRFHYFTEEEIIRIPAIPSSIISEPPFHFKNVSIRNFRKLQNVTVENLGLINLVVGDNNVGKTTFLESLLFTSDPEQLLTRLAFAFIERKNLFPSVSITSEGSRYFYKLEKNFLLDFKNHHNPTSPTEYIIENNRSEWKYTLHLDDLRQHDISPGTISFSEDNWLLVEELNAVDLVKTPLIAYGKGFGSDLAKSYFEEVISRPEIEKNVVQSMRLFIPGVERIIADTATGGIHIYDRDFPEIPLPLHQYGEGANKLFRILVLLVIHREKRVLIDEIDAGIHFSRFPAFWKTIITVAIENNTQIIATTHNDECIKYYAQILEKLGLDCQKRARVVQLKNVADQIKIRSYEYNSFNEAIDNNFELRGGDKL